MERAHLEQALWLARRQHGALHRQQVLAAGITRHALEHLVASGRWQRPLPRVCGTNPTDLSAMTWASAAALHVEHAGALARQSAAALHGVMPWPETTHVVVTGRHQLSHPRLTVHRTRSLLSRDVTSRLSITVTTPLRTLIDLGAELDPISLGDVFAQMLRKRLLTKAQVADRLSLMPQAPGTAALRTMVVITGSADSGPELVLAVALQEAGLRVVLNHSHRCPSGRVRRADIYLPDLGIVIQVESVAFHSGARSEQDMERDSDWAAAGLLTIRVPPKRMRRALASIVDEIVSLARTLRPVGGGLSASERPALRRGLEQRLTALRAEALT